MQTAAARLFASLAVGVTVAGAGGFGWTAAAGLERRAAERVAAMARAAGADWLVMEVDGLRVTIAGVAPDEAGAEAARAAAAAAGRFARVVDLVAVAEPAPPPPDVALTLVIGEGGATLSGVAPTANTRLRLAEALPGVVADTAEDARADGASPPGWRMIEAAAVRAAEALAEGSVTLGAQSFSVAGRPRSAADRAEIEALAAGLAAEGATVSLDLADAAPGDAAPGRTAPPPVAASRAYRTTGAQDADAPGQRPPRDGALFAPTGPETAGPWLRARADADLVVLTGAAPDAATRDAVIAYAGARFGADRVHHGLTVSAAAGREGWRAAALAALNALAALDEGEAAAKMGVATLSGVTTKPDAARAAHRALADAETSGWRTASRVTVDLPARAARARLPLDLCAERLSAITAASPILFAPASAEIDGDSEPALDALAEVLGRCDGGEIVVEGHTDSQGSAGYNLALSQRRAEAVRTALATRGAPKAALTARGYGQERPIADNATEEGRAQNRRIAFAATPPEAVAKGDAAAGDEAP
ncbi:MAG: OmpA family protein [Rhodobacteraceae bacterium]|nr:MAG: OmpA family protein [Paracoccaceae bacterium]